MSLVLLVGVLSVSEEASIAILLTVKWSPGSLGTRGNIRAVAEEARSRQRVAWRAMVRR